jgi:hypothetical protein
VGTPGRGLLKAAAVAGVGALAVELARRHPFDPVPAAVRRAPPYEHAYLQPVAAR